MSLYSVAVPLELALNDPNCGQHGLLTAVPTCMHLGALTAKSISLEGMGGGFSGCCTRSLAEPRGKCLLGEL